MKLTIERPHRECEEEVRQLLDVTIRHTFKSEGVELSHADDLDKEIRYQWDCLARDFTTGGQDECFLVARCDGLIVGTTARGKPNRIIVEHLSPDSAICPEIKSVYILPEYQGKGIGSALFDAIRNRLRSEKIKEFCLDSGYTKAQGFWTNKLGEPTVLLRDYWCPDGHHMIWHRPVGSL